MTNDPIPRYCLERFLPVSDMNTAASRANQLERRLPSFAARIGLLSSKLPRTPQGRHICSQILRSGTATAANYGEARGAESRADFIHKLKVVFKELNETTIWLEVIAESSLLSPENILAIVGENRWFRITRRQTGFNSRQGWICCGTLTVKCLARDASVIEL
jgi:four helix bundle protein